jgi:adenylate cyclase
MGADVDIEASGLLDGVEGQARRDRTELIAWLVERGFDIEHIRGSVAAPLLLPANRVLGDDGRCVSARQLCESTGIELELLHRLQGAVGLPQVDDPDSAVWLRADAEAVAHAKAFMDMGVDPEETVVLMRVLICRCQDSVVWPLTRADGPTMSQCEPGRLALAVTPT